MKRKIYYFVPIFLISVIIIISITPSIAMSERISEKIFRIHILANSNNDYDQELKLKVRDNILSNTKDLFENCDNINDAIKIASENIDCIEDIAQATVAFYGYDYDVNARVDKEFFNTRKYDGFILPAGIYDCLKIEIGKAEGHNWWCVMYPSVCLSGCVEDLGEELSEDEIDLVTSKRYITKFKTVEIYEKLKYKILSIKNDTE